MLLNLSSGFNLTGFNLTKLPLIFLLCIFTFLSGCSSSDDSDPAAPVSNIGFVQFVNLVPDAPMLFSKANDKNLQSASFAQASTRGKMEASSSYDLDVFYRDYASALQSLVANQTLNIVAEADTTILLTGAFASPTVIQIENPEQNITEGADLAEIQFIHASTLTTGSIDVYLTAPTDSLTGATPKATLALQEFSTLTEIDSTVEYRIRITEAATLNLLWDSGTFSLNRLSRNLIAVLDYFGPGTGTQNLRAIKIDPNGNSEFPAENLVSGFRFTNTISDSISVDLYFGSTAGTPLFTAVPFGATTAYLTLPAGAQNVNVTPVGLTTTFLFEKSIGLIAGEFRNMVAAGNTYDSSVGGRLLLEENRRIATENRLRLVQASSSIGEIDFYLLAPGQNINDANPEFGSLLFMENGVSSLKEGTYDVVITPAGKKTFLLGPQRITILNSGIYSIVISDPPGGGTPIQIILGDDFIL